MKPHCLISCFRRAGSTRRNFGELGGWWTYRIIQQPEATCMIIRHIAFIAQVFSATAWGSISAENSWVAFSADGRQVLVLLSPYSDSGGSPSDGSPSAIFPDGQQLALRETFTKSGVYDVATLTPKWQVDWYALQRDVLGSDDMRYVAVINRTGFHRGCAVAFFDRGRLVRAYNCADFLTGMSREEFLPFTSSDWHTQWYDNFALSSDHRSVNLSTARRRINLAGCKISLGLQEFYTFDLATGSITSRRTEGAWLVWTYGAAIMLVAAGLVLAARGIWIWHRNRALRRRVGFLVE
jgi:hypothetical protein